MAYRYAWAAVGTAPTTTKSSANIVKYVVNSKDHVHGHVHVHVHVCEARLANRSSNEQNVQRPVQAPTATPATRVARPQGPTAVSAHSSQARSRVSPCDPDRSVMCEAARGRERRYVTNTSAGSVPTQSVVWLSRTPRTVRSSTVLVRYAQPKLSGSATLELPPPKRKLVSTIASGSSSGTPAAACASSGSSGRGRRKTTR